MADPRGTAIGTLAKGPFFRFVITGTLFQFFANLMQGTVATYFSNYMTDTALIPAGAASIIMLVACVWDLFLDPTIGGVIERTNSRWGRYRPYILISAPVLTIVTFFLFFDISGLPEVGRILYMLVFYLLFGSALTLYVVPTTAVITSSIGNMEQRNKAFMAAGIGVGAAFTIASTWTEDISNLLGGGAFYCWNMLLYGVPFCLVGILYYRSSREDYVTKHEKTPALKSLKVILRHRAVWSCIVIWVLASLGYGLMFSSSVYYIKYYIATDMSQWALIGTYMFVISMGALVSMVVFQPIFLKLFRYDHNKTMMLSQVLTLVLYVVLFFFGRTSFVFLCVVSFLATCFNAMTQAVQAAYIGDTIDYIQLKEGSTFGAMVNSIKIFACKVGSAFANYGVLAMLAATGYVENVVGAGQSAAAVEGINLFRFGLPAVCCLLMLVVTALYPIRKSYPEIRAMKERMAAELDP